MADAPQRNEDLIGYDLDAVKPGDTVITLPDEIPESELDIRRFEGISPQPLDPRELAEAVRKLGYDTVFITAGLHVHLDARTPWVAGRGHLNLIRISHVWCDVPRVDWLSWLDVNGIGGIIEAWLHGLTVGAQYIMDITIAGGWRSANSAFKVGTSMGFHANFGVPSGYPTQHLLGVLQPTSSLGLVRLEPIDLDSWSFHNIRITQV